MSKLSLHISDWLNPELTYDFIERTRPPVIKVFGDSGLDDAKLAEAKRRSPATLFIGRMYFPHQQAERDEREPVDTVFNYDPVADARSAFGQMQGIMSKLSGLIDVWEGYNEIPLDTQAPLTERERQKARNYSAFTVEMARLMHGAGQRYAAYSFSTGNPVHLELWDLLIPGLRASDYLALHEYIAPDEQWQNFDFSMMNRYRAIYERIPADARKPILITETGTDFLGQQGYKGRISAQQYLAQLAQYDGELMKDANVLGATIFCYGINAPQWKTYDIGGDFTRLLVQHILANPTPPMEHDLPVENVPTGPVGVPIGKPPAAPLLTLDQARAWTEEAVRKLENGEAQPARQILVESVIPWFYATAPHHSQDLENAEAHTAARWFGEEAIRKIEAGDTNAARTLLNDNVLPWLRSPGPRALGILSVKLEKGTARRRTPRPAAKQDKGLLLSPSEDKPAQRPKPRRGRKSPPRHK